MQDNIPVFSALIAVLVLWVTYRQHLLTQAQHLLAQERFKLDLFEKRFAVYKAAEKMLGAVYAKSRLETQEYWDYARDTQDAVFLFGPEIPEYLKKLHQKAAELRITHGRLAASIGNENWSDLSTKENDLLQEMEDELQKLKSVFLPYLKFHTWK
jgi:hypothetical protein